jgi:hypothetical protein
MREKKSKQAEQDEGQAKQDMEVVQRFFRWFGSENPEEFPGLLHLRHTALILRVPVFRAADLVRQKILSGVYLGRQVRIDPVQLRDFIANGGKRFPVGEALCSPEKLKTHTASGRPRKAPGADVSPAVPTGTADARV